MNQQYPYPMSQGPQPMGPQTYPMAGPQMGQPYQAPQQMPGSYEPNPYEPQTQGPQSSPQQPQGSPQQPQGKSGLAIAGLVLGIVGVATSFIPIVNNASFFIALVGLVLGIIGFVQTRKGTKGGAGLAIAAIVLNVVACIVVLATQTFYGAVIDEALSTSPASIASSSASSAAQGGASQDGSSASASASSASSAASAAPASASDYEVTIDDATVGTDYSGNRALIVTYTWTNNSDKATSFSAALYPKCFQDGVQCDMAFVSGLGGDSLSQVKPGASNTVQQAYELSGTSDATVEVTELISFDDTILAEKTFSVA